MRNNNLGKITSANINTNFDPDIILNIESMSSIKNNSYDYCILFHVLSEVEKDILALNELNRVTKLNGYVIICDILYPTFKNLQNSPDAEKHHRIYSPQYLKDLLSNYFKVDIEDPINNSCCKESKLFVCKKIKHYRIENKEYSME